MKKATSPSHVQRKKKRKKTQLPPFWTSWLKKTYTDPKHPASYRGWLPLWKAAQQVQKKRIKPSQAQVKAWLQTQDTYTLHRPARRRFARDHYRVGAVDQLWQADLSDMSAFQKDNQGVRYLLCIIDVFSKMAWVQPLKAKTSRALTEAFQDLIEGEKTQGRLPEQLQTDKGTEFLNRPFQALMNTYDIHFYTSQNPETKAAVVERFQRTLKNKMWRYFTQHKTRHYLKILPQLVQSYNKSVHRTIGRRPIDVQPHDPVTEIRVLDYMKKKKKKPTLKKKRPLLTPGTRVRLNKSKGSFDKGYLPNWTTELFTVDRVVKGRVPAVYRVRDDQGQRLKGTFYREELQPVIKTDDVYPVDQILDRRHNKATQEEEVLVRWSGYPASFDSWIPAQQLL